MKVALFDYGAGNLHSLAKALERGGASVTVTSDWTEALSADALVLPGVGSFGAAVRALEGHETRVRQALDDGLPCLGICLGMQLLFPESDEAEGAGIGLIPGRVRLLEAGTVPQMGWNDIRAAGDDPVLGPAEELTGYYANSYVCDPEDASAVTGWSQVEGFTFPASVRRANTWGFQFHPEKSSGPGLDIIGRWIDAVRGIQADRPDPGRSDAGEESGS
jgi:glutamine amidotransferase